MYAFLNGMQVRVIEAKKSDAGENVTTAEEQSSRYANSTFKWDAFGNKREENSQEMNM